jgi:hypothetical protein
MKQYQFGGLGAAIAGAAMLLSLGAIPAHAQAPGGSYLDSCTNIRAFGDRLIADCRRMDGSWGRTALHDLGSCSGDVGNMNGQLTCNRGGAGYGSSYQYAPTPNYGYRGGYYGYGR